MYVCMYVHAYYIRIAKLFKCENVKILLKKIFNNTLPSMYASEYCLFNQRERERKRESEIFTIFFNTKERRETFFWL